MLSYAVVVVAVVSCLFVANISYLHARNNHACIEHRKARHTRQTQQHHSLLFAEYDMCMLLACNTLCVVLAGWLDVLALVYGLCGCPLLLCLACSVFPCVCIVWLCSCPVLLFLACRLISLALLY